ncbi:cadmium-translocating P-type ATPase [Rhodococcus sp. BP-252]|uniref:heavy metal translocating P-type ATPase n=1 Tax=Rhodococcus sp. B10 TaxID=2695876 RepID=UPI00143150E2|nr:MULTISPECIES: heavy metal translocating P-type ATPase [unclassified Rhodococcus (in: high G+C Gram-positive bacteria)]NIL74066.1 putative cobalt/nickel-exporting P-type ATPase [Rhodococcus sp. B10]MBY6410386.1 cadmium-translocating P-type ATPase [Rhodococcus sp. BP-320]MBY6416268.1 cadmium-translocating P-type ATPase [Rhodococcus sp. BP-321]MBY6420263.1 cadmium-translocating P-type ATPase [Rhodococcus sp. BP-324]MBY6424942.1 cadmium-translocating P-type ATPase [Rhodococcus sp. BP-323]
MLSVPEVRWALASLVFFLAGLALQLSPAPSALAWALYLACYACGGWEPALEGLRALREKSLDVDLLMIVAAVGAAAIGQIFDGALLIVIFATSGALEAVLTRRTADSVRSLLDLAPDTADVLGDDGTERNVPASSLRPGDVVVVRPGSRIAGEGTVVDGGSDVDQSSITGESVPVYKSVGDSIFAGSVNGTGTLRVRIDVDPSETVIARIVAMVEHASATKAKKQLFIDKVEQYYSTIVVVATVAIFAIPMFLGSEFQPALLRAMTFMIVASPCAVVLATMPPLLAAMSTAGRSGVLVKSAVVMEQLRTTSVVAFDKTGTLTEGTPRVDTVELLPGSDYDENSVLRLAAAVETASEHPVAAAVVGYARARGLTLPDVSAFESSPGSGVSGVVEGRLVTVTKPAGPDNDLGVVRSALSAGKTAVVVRVDGAPTAVIGVADTVRADAAAAVADLEALTGRPSLLLTGDNTRAAQDVARRTGIDDVRADLLPEQKAEAVRAVQAESGARVLLVGDGVNDAPALAASDIGVAMGRKGSDLALDTADAVLVRDDLGALASVIALSRRAHRIVVANLVIAATFIVVLVTWDLIGTLPLPVGVAGHESSTVLVALNGMRLLSTRAWRRSHER